MLDLATVLQELESQVRQDRPAQTSLLLKRMKHCAKGRCPLDLERARSTLRSERYIACMDLITCLASVFFRIIASIYLE